MSFSVSWCIQGPFFFPRFFFFFHLSSSFTSLTSHSSPYLSLLCLWATAPRPAVYSPPSYLPLTPHLITGLQWHLSSPCPPPSPLCVCLSVNPSVLSYLPLVTFPPGWGSCCLSPSGPGLQCGSGTVRQGRGDRCSYPRPSAPPGPSPGSPAEEDRVPSLRGWSKNIHDLTKLKFSLTKWIQSVE